MTVNSKIIYKPTAGFKVGDIVIEKSTNRKVKIEAFRESVFDGFNLSQPEKRTLDVVYLVVCNYIGSKPKPGCIGFYLRLEDLRKVRN